MTVLAWLLVVVPLAAGGALAVAGRRADRAAPAVGVVAGMVTLALAGVSAVSRPATSAPLFTGIHAGLRVDGLSAVMVVTVAAVTTAVLLFSVGDSALAASRFFGLMLLFAAAMLITVTATTLPLLLMGWEVMGATSWALIGFWWRQPRRVRAANTAFLSTRAADLGLYLAAGAALAGGAASLRLDALPHTAEPWLTVLTAGMVIAALGKSAQLPLSFWLSRAMEGPSPVSALLHAATMVAAGAYLLLRLHPLLAATGWAGPAVAWAGASTALLLGLVAIAQTDLKQLLAASTCAQVGFMVLSAGAGGVAGGVTQLVAHAATKALLFLAAGVWLTVLGSTVLADLRGAARVHRLVGVTFTVGIATLAGLPPLSLWAGKDEVLAAAFARQPGLYVAGLAAAVLATVYSGKAAWYLLRSDPVSAEAGRRVGSPDVPVVTNVSLVVLAAAAVVLGVLALPGPSRLVRQTLGVLGEPAPLGWQLAASAAVAIVAAVLAWRWTGTRVPVPSVVTGWLTRWLDLERAAHLLVVRPTLALARALAAFDDRIIDNTVRQATRAALRLARAVARVDDRGVDGAVRQATRGGLRLAHTAARVDDGGVDGIVTAIAAEARRLGRAARRPQTGVLHQYYTQLVVALAALALLLLLAG
ncbi:proton-conducting transporter membrane subunit [Plantactinospora sp. KLBMP9567]|uniref:proton-conducting transporter transmembrane domain-containing protein n=1 Tax=Plantactinospora sp. KLBMP9567 TaxID=3085900 RepID=UPI0029814BA3|nr:proton-conducting transporter membrane subunit [Plantactinospora sp. KLBMP9567]MDW5327126.1 proton-conducting transporter membrane subunit [Plantactinospora sp. KLBMP9567]